MSDSDFMGEDAGFDFEYSGSEQEEVQIDLENLNYEAKGFKLSDLKRAINEVKKVVELGRVCRSRI